MINNVRHSGIFNASDFSVALIGAGGIGSPTALALAKMGIPDIVVFDFDQVDSENVSCQMYGNEDIGMWKVEALKSLVSRYADDVIFPVAQRINGEHVDLGGFDIIISAVDSLKARKDIWREVKLSECAWYLDARMGSEIAQLLSVDLRNSDWYESVLYAISDEDVPDEPCTSKSTVYCGFSIAGHLGRAVRMIVTGEHRPGILTHNIKEETIYTVAV